MLKPNHIVIPALVAAVATAGSILTGRGMTWYQTITLPPWTPEGSVIGAVWTTLFVLAAISILIIWNKPERTWVFKHIIRFFVLNGLVNVLWSLVFFTMHMMGLAVAVAALLELTVLMLILISWKTSRAAALLLVPYAGWVAFATYLTYAVWALNA